MELRGKDLLKVFKKSLLVLKIVHVPVDAINAFFNIDRDLTVTIFQRRAVNQLSNI